MTLHPSAPRAEDSGEGWRDRERLRLLADAGAEFAAVLDRDATLRALARLAVGHFASWCLVFETQPDGAIRVAHALSRRAEVAENVQRIATLLRELPESRQHLVRRVMRTRQTIHLASPDLADFARHSTSDEFHRVVNALAPVWVVATALASRGLLYGVAVFGADASLEHTGDADVALAEELSRRAVVALENASLHAAERAARQAAEEAGRRIAFVAEASARLDGSLEYAATLAALAELAVPALADWCFVEMLEDDGVVRPAKVVHRDPAMVALGYEVLNRWPIDLEAPFGTGKVLRTGEPELAPDIPPEVLTGVAQDAEHARHLERAGFVSSLSVPLAVRGRRPFGVLTLASSESGRRFDVDDLVMAEEVARRAGVAIDRARRFTMEQAALERARALQNVSAALSAAMRVEDVAAVVVEQCVAAIGAQAGSVTRVTDDALELVGSIGYDDGAMGAWQRIPLDAPIPMVEAVRTGRPVFLQSEAEWERRYSPLAPVRAMPDSRSWAALPLSVQGRVLGAMGLSFRRQAPFSAEERGFMMAVAQQCAQALERARLFEAEHAARSDAERASRAKSEFLAVMSHELRTPLNAIGGYAELMSLGIRGPLTDQQREDLERIQRSQKHLLGLINEVLNYTRLEAGAVGYEMTDVAVAEVVGAVESLLLPQVRQRELLLDASGCRTPIAVRADPDKLQQILLNLLSNAVKHTASGGRITVSCEARGHERDAAVVDILVADTGTGIPPEKLETIFEPFVQVGRALNAPRDGVGLGLSISRDLARGMHGDLTVSSRPGHGSTFTVTLPRAMPAAGQNAQPTEKRTVG